jgi:hypothetical protein
MSSDVLIWAAVPHNNDGVVFQVRIALGHQRFHISRSVLEGVFDLEPLASDAKQLELFYQFMKRILGRAEKKRSIAGLDTVALLAIDFTLSSKRDSRSNLQAGAGRAA